MAKEVLWYRPQTADVHARLGRQHASLDEQEHAGNRRRRVTRDARCHHRIHLTNSLQVKPNHRYELPSCRRNTHVTQIIPRSFTGVK